MGGEVAILRKFRLTEEIYFAMKYQLDYKKLGMCVRGARKGRGLRETAAEISREVSEISPSTLSRLEGERVEDISVSTLLTICSWLNIPPDEFITDLEDRASNGSDLSLSDEVELLLFNSKLKPHQAKILSAMIRAGIEAAIHWRHEP
jgi:transcriptional regulator with XRE-family HTH domain